MSMLAETICECVHRKKYHNEWSQCSKCGCSGFHWMDGLRRAKIEVDAKKVIKNRKKGSRKNTALSILALIGIYGGMILFRAFI